MIAQDVAILRNIDQKLARVEHLLEVVRDAMKDRCVDRLPYYNERDLQWANDRMKEVQETRMEIQAAVNGYEAKADNGEAQ